MTYLLNKEWDSWTRGQNRRKMYLKGISNGTSCYVTEATNIWVSSKSKTIGLMKFLK